MPFGKCKLCLRGEELQKSHLIPAAIFRTLRFEGEGAISTTAKEIVSDM
ncbi:MAG: hypothetical protein ABSA96_06830 [Candidatus Acidiferrales bacterium]|jgi:hypothetical protein